MQSKHILVIEGEHAEDSIAKRFSKIITTAHEVIFGNLAPEAVEATTIKAILAHELRNEV